MNNEILITEIARNTIAGFLLTLGITPSEGEDTLEIRDYGPHRVYTQQARVPDSMADTIDAAAVFAQLRIFLLYHNAVPTAVRFYPYISETYVCPCGCGTFLYVSVYHDAEF